MKWATERTILLAAFFLALLILGAVGLLSYHTTMDLISATGEVQRSHQVIENVAHLLSALQDAETGQRGYVLTGEPAYLNPYHGARKAIDQSFSDLRVLVAERPMQLQRLQAVQPLVREKLAELEETIRLRDEEGFKAAQQLVLTNQGEHLTGHIRSILDTMDNREDEVLRARDAKMRADARDAILTTFLGIAVSAALLAGVFGFLSREVTQRRKAEADQQALARQEAAIAALSQQALSGVALGPLMDEAATIAAGTLGVDYGKILELLPDGKALLLRAGEGWEEGLVGQAKVGAQKESQAGFTLLSREPVVVEDLRRETRFTGSALLRDHNVLSGLSVTILDGRGVFGVLTAHTTRLRHFRRDEINFLQAIANVLGNAIQRKRAEDAVRAQAEIIDQVHDSIVATDLDGHVTSWNQGAVRLFGYLPEEALGKHICFVYPDGQRTVLEREVIQPLKQRGVHEVEVTMVRKSGEEFYARLSLSLLRDTQGVGIGMIGYSIDITERKRAEEALRRANAYNRSLIEASLDPLVTIGPDGKITDVNGATERVTGLSQTELIGTDFSDYFTEPEKARAGYQQAFREGLVRDYELAVRHRDGHTTPVFYNASVYRDDAGKVVGVFAAARDISERKQAEAELRQLNRALRAISECNQALIHAADESQLLQKICDIAVRVGGYRMAWVGYAEHDEGKAVRPMAHAGYEDGYLDTVNISWADTERGRGPTGMVIRTCKTCFIEDFAAESFVAPWREQAMKRGYACSISLPLMRNGEAFGALTIYSRVPDAFHAQERVLLEELAADLSFGINSLRSREARKLAEEALHDSEERFRQMAENVQEVFWMTDATASQMLYVNPAYELIWGRSCESLYRNPDSWMEAIHPEDRDRALQDWNEQIPHGEYRAEFRIVRPDGSVRWIWDRSFPIRDAKGEIRRVVGIAADITERRQTDEKIRRSEKSLAEAQAIAHLGSWDLDLASGTLSWSHEVYRIFGFTPLSFGSTYEAFLSTVHRGDRKFVEKSVQEALAGEKPYSVDHRIVLPGGAIRIVHEQGEVFYDEAGTPVRMVGTVQDVTERKRAEEALRRANEALRKEIAERVLAQEVLRAQTDALIHTLNAITAEPELQKISGQVLVAVNTQLKAHSTALWLYDPVSDTSRLHQTAYGTSVLMGDQQLGHPTLSVPVLSGPGSHFGVFLDKDKPFVFGDAPHNPLIEPEVRAWMAEHKVKTLLSVPLVFGQKAIGALSIRDTERARFTPEEIKMAQALAHQVTLALMLTRLAEQEQQSAVLGERNRMAREIHDTLAQGFTGILIQLQVAEDLLDESKDGALSHLGRARTLARDSLAEARRSVWALRPQTLEKADLPGALARLADQCKANTGIETKFALRGAPRPLSAEIEENLLRIVQEALTNAAKHSRASAIDVMLAYESGQVRLSVKDNGQGFDLHQEGAPKGFGLISLRERAERISVTLDIDSQPGAGTSVSALLSLAGVQSNGLIDRGQSTEAAS
jgi:PAS domain S-box-containing protein